MKVKKDIYNEYNRTLLSNRSLIAILIAQLATTAMS